MAPILMSYLWTFRCFTRVRFTTTIFSKSTNLTVPVILKTIKLLWSNSMTSYLSTQKWSPDQSVGYRASCKLELDRYFVICNNSYETPDLENWTLNHDHFGSIIVPDTPWRYGGQLAEAGSFIRKDCQPSTSSKIFSKWKLFLGGESHCHQWFLIDHHHGDNVLQTGCSWMFKTFLDNIVDKILICTAEPVLGMVQILE